MQNSKLIRLLRTFSAREWKSFLDFAKSPYFNRNGEVTGLCEWLAAAAPGFDNADRRAAYAAIFPGQAYDETRLNHLMSFALKLGERFLAFEKLEDDGFTVDYHTLQSLAERGLEKEYRFLFEKKHTVLWKEKRRDARFYLENYWLENLEANRLSRSTVRKFNEHVQRTADHLDAFYLAEKLRCTCYMLTSQYVIATPYNLQLVQEISRFVENLPVLPEAPAIQAYFRIFQLMTKEDSQPDFEALKALLAGHEASFGAEEMAELYQYAINYCNLQIMKAKEYFVGEALELYIQGVESGILLQNGFLSPWHFKNMIKLGLRLKKYDWTEHFILNNNRFLENEYRQDALYYNLAELYYHTHRYDEAMVHLNKMEFTDLHYNLGAKVILAKIYFETEAYDALESLLHAFRTYLHRNKLISEDLRRAYLNFIVLLTQVIGTTAEKRLLLQEKAAKMQLLAEKNWLFGMIGLKTASA